ncbi:efflux RND transporter periplasmic adaptor subunit [Flagellimonas sp.]|uniref:efflux RND transporter periplasmic adaptor subunit n=1 Tax=Flagellimonas sp. TaxID=2058762 RepID=UPI003B5103E7
MKNKHLFFCSTLLKYLLILFLMGCKNSENLDKKPANKLVIQVKLNQANLQVLAKQPFEKEILANGKLVAKQKSALSFKVSGVLKHLRVKNGDNVEKGRTLAILSSLEYQQAFSIAKTVYQKANLDFQDILVSRGYNLSRPDSIPDNIYEMASIRSGLKEAKSQMEKSQFELESATLIAPFSGKVANIKNRIHEQVSAETTFMTLIDDSILEVEFYLLESEVGEVFKGHIVSVEALNKDYSGEIVSINPLVEKNGTVLIKARIKNDGNLLEGMNVNVKLQREIPNQFVVPKSAILIRNNQEVVFKYKNGKTFWTYVISIAENSQSYAIKADPDKNSATISEGDTIIISENLNLAHDVNVILED